VEEIPRRPKSKLSEERRGRLALEYPEAAKESMDTYKDMEGTLNDGLYETKYTGS